MSHIQLWVVWTMGSLEFFLFLIQQLECKYSFLKTLLVYLIMIFFCMAFKVYDYTNRGGEFFPEFAIALFLIHLIFAVRFFHGTWINKVMVVILTYSVTAIAEVFTLAVLANVFSVDLSRITEPVVFFSVYAIEFVVILLFLSITAILWRKYRVKCSMKSEGCFALMLFAHLIVMTPVITGNIRLDGHIPWESMAGILFGILLTAFLPVIMKETAGREDAEESLEKLKDQYELEEVHYRLLENKRKEMQKIEHDFRNRLAAVYSLAGSGQREKALEMLREMELEIGEPEIKELI